MLIEWARPHDRWIRQLVGDVIATGRALSDDRATALYNLLLWEKGLAGGVEPALEDLRAVTDRATSDGALTLLSLEHLENVNALAPNQIIKFHSRLTICFGENASGKTGYVRILKQAAGARTAESVLPNVRVGGTATPKARIRFRVPQGERSITWCGDSGVEPLTRVAVFDSRVAVAHLRENLTFAYTPAALAVFPLVMDGIDRVRELLQADRTKREPTGNPFPTRFSDGSPLSAKMRDLTASTEVRELEVLANVSEQEEAAIPALRQTVDALRAGMIPAQLDSATRRRDALTLVVECAEAAGSFDRDRYSDAVTALKLARSNHERATRSSLEAEPVPGILDGPWKGLVEAAESYIQALGLDPYPTAGEACVYCRQSLDAAATSLLQKYRDYCNAALRRGINQAQDHLRAIAKPILDLPLEDAIRDITASLQSSAAAGRDSGLFSASRRLLDESQKLREALASEQECASKTRGFDPDLAAVRAARDAAETAVRDLQGKGTTRAETLSREEASLKDLQDRLTLRELMPEIRAHLDAVRWADQARTYLGTFQGIKQGLTVTSKRASQEVLNKDFAERFEEERRALRAPPVTLEFPGREGETRRRKMLTPEHGLDAVLSEGEQKVVALADFLADSSLNPDQSPMIFDDPVTSLDHRRVRYVADRISQLSRDRQVIVFTHDILFAAELLARFETEARDCTFLEVTADDEIPGRITGGSHPRTDTFNDRKQRITKLIDGAKGASGDQRQTLVQQGYEELRGACEVVVEKELLKGVVERYRPNVRMTTLSQIDPDRFSVAVQKIMPVFDRCSRAIRSHSQPSPTLGVRPTIDELEGDWEILRGAHKLIVG